MSWPDLTNSFNVYIQVWRLSRTVGSRSFYILADSLFADFAQEIEAMAPKWQVHRSAWGSVKFIFSLAVEMAAENWRHSPSTIRLLPQVLLVHGLVLGSLAKGQLKAYGAGFLSSFEEPEYTTWLTRLLNGPSNPFRHGILVRLLGWREFRWQQNNLMRDTTLHSAHQYFKNVTLQRLIPRLSQRIWSYATIRSSREGKRSQI